MPGAVARTSAVALNNATLPFTLQLADKGWQRACAGVNCGGPCQPGHRSNETRCATIIPS
jgi:hypothetical protein